MSRGSCLATLKHLLLNCAGATALAVVAGALLVAGAMANTNVRESSYAPARAPAGETNVVIGPPTLAPGSYCRLQTTNLGTERAVIFTGHILSGDHERPGGSILYAPSDEDDATYRAAISAAAGGVTVDYFDARVDTPSVTLLSNYDCVYTWAYFAYSDKVQFGDNLATYVDQGGKVVLGVFCTFTQWNHLAGAIMTEAYCPVTSPTGGAHGESSTYSGDGATCIHDGITAYECIYRDELVLQGAGLQDGSYLDGEIAHAYRPDFRVIYSNGSGAVSIGGSGEWPQLIADACDCATPGDLNCDGSTNGLDIDPFVLALTSTPPDYPEYYAQHPGCDVTLADCNADGTINGLDIDPFVAILTGG